MPATPTLLITTLAEYQTRFWLPVAQGLIASGRPVEVLAFDDRSAEMLAAAGVPATNMYRAGLAAPASVDDPVAFAERLKLYGIADVNLLFSHERITFAIRDTAALARRFMIYANALEGVLDRLAAAGQRSIMLQELGGFLSVIASYYGARRRGILNLFLEPSFFRGRLLFVPNSFAAAQVMSKPAQCLIPEVQDYLDATYKAQAIVVPLKDKHQYAPAFAKVLNVGNARRLAEKLYDQYALGKHQEFGHNLQHAKAHARMAANNLAMRRHYRSVPEGQRFIYYPLHVPADMALTLRSPQYLDQLALVDYILRVMPSTHLLAIKEHPAQIGAIPATRMKALLARYDNLVILPPRTNNYTVLEKADAIVSVNSKSGAEALLLGKPVVVLGDAFYGDCPLVLRCVTIAALGDSIREALLLEHVDRVEVAKYLQTAWDRTLPGELYVTEPGQITTFVSSARTALEMYDP